MMYRLEDFSLKELRILDRLIINRMDEKVEQVDAIKANIRHDGEIKKRLLDNAYSDLPELREMHVRVLTSIAMKKESDTVNQN